MKSIEAVAKFREIHPEVSVDEIIFLEQVTLEVDKNELKKALAYFKKELKPGYEVLMDLTGVDYLHPEKHTKVLYLLHNPTSLQRIFIKVAVKRGEILPSVTDMWEGADWYERELYDLFGVNFEGHPDMKRILMPLDWVGHPLQRDYALQEEPVQFKFDVKPKIPSQIIPHVHCRKKDE